jgi:general secretion pathway protein A
MYEEFYGLNQLPFQLLPDPDFFYRSQKHDKALTYLEYGVFERAGFVVITGEIGTGKTTLLRYLLRSLSEDIPTVLINQTYLGPEDLLRMLCQEFSLPYEGKEKSELIELFGTYLIEQYQAGRYVRLILDEAQNLPLDTLEEIRMLSNLDADNERLLQIILVGQPPLRKKLHREGLRQLMQRVEVSYHLEPLDREDLQKYVHYRLKTAGAKDNQIFEDAAIDAMYDSTGGVPRLINLICHRCLVYGFADGQKKITMDLFQKMLEDRKAEGLYPPHTVIPSTPNAAIDSKASEQKDKSEDTVSPAHLVATLNRLTEISGASIKAIELAAAKAANSTGDAELASLKRQLAKEKKLRIKLENRLTRTEDELSNIEKALSQRIPTPAHQPSSNLRPRPVRRLLKSSSEQDRKWFLLNPKRHILPLLLFIVTGILFAILVFWRPQGKDTKEPKPELKSGVLKYKVAQANVSPEKINERQPQPEKPSSAGRSADDRIPDAGQARANVSPEKINERQPQPEEPSSAGRSTDARIPDAGQAQAKIDSSQIKTDQNGDESVRSPVMTAPEKAPDTERHVSHKIESEKYVCIVNMANVRDRPNMKGRILGRITQGTEVAVIGKEGSWMQLKYQGEEEAWIYGTLLRRQD